LAPKPDVGREAARNYFEGSKEKRKESPSGGLGPSLPLKNEKEAPGGALGSSPIAKEKEGPALTKLTTGQLTWIADRGLELAGSLRRTGNLTEKQAEAVTAAVLALRKPERGKERDQAVVMKAMGDLGEVALSAGKNNRPLWGTVNGLTGRMINRSGELSEIISSVTGEKGELSESAVKGNATLTVYRKKLLEIQGSIDDKSFDRMSLFQQKLHGMHAIAIIGRTQSLARKSD
jgi:hypothetical protein